MGVRWAWIQTAKEMFTPGFYNLIVMIPKPVTSIQTLSYPMASNRLRQDMLPTSNAEHGKPNKEESQSHPRS